MAYADVTVPHKTGSEASTPIPSQPRRSRLSWKSHGAARLVLSILLLNGYATAEQASASLEGRNLPTSSLLEPRRIDPAAARRPIRLTQSLPSTSSLPPQLSSTFESILDSLASTAASLTARTLRSTHLSSSSSEGIPGTAITANRDFDSIQAYLDCTIGNGEWAYDRTGTSLAKEGKGLLVHKMDSKYSTCDKRFYKTKALNKEDEWEEEQDWHVRESLKFRFDPNPSCRNLLPDSLKAKSGESLMPSRKRLCQLLAHKSLLLLGSTSQYSLHDLILDYTTTEPQSCYGDLYCKEHALCGGILSVEEAETGTIENWDRDQRVYHRLPLPPAHELEPQLRDESLVKQTSSSSRYYPSSTYSTLLRYRRTDGLRPSTAQTLPSYQHPFTHLAEKNQQWLADSRRSDVVVLEKSPIPLPLRNDNSNSTFDAWFYEYLEDASVKLDDKVERILEATKQVTETVWLPELMETLRAIRNEPSPSNQLIIYNSGWRIQYDCAMSPPASDPRAWDSPGDGFLPPHSQAPDLRRLIFRTTATNLENRGEPQLNGKDLQPLHVVYHNLQLLVQNHLVRHEILPKFGVVYLDLETPLSIWRTGLLGSSSAGKEVTGLRSSVSGDCTRYCFPSPGLSLERAFVGGLERLFELAWAGDETSEKEWVGPEFKNLRLRMNDPGNSKMKV